MRRPRQGSLGVREPHVLPTDPEPGARLPPGSEGGPEFSGWEATGPTTAPRMAPESFLTSKGRDAKEPKNAL